MIRLGHKLLIQAFRVFDQVLLGIALLVPALLLGDNPSLHWPEVFNRSFRLKDFLGPMLLFVGWVWIYNHHVRYNANRFVGLWSQILDIVQAATLAAFLLFLVDAALSFYTLKNEVILLFWLGACLLGVLSRLFIRLFLTELRRSGRNCRYLLIVGRNARSLEMARKIEASPELGYKIVGIIEDGGNAPSSDVASADPCPWPVVGDLPNLRQALEQRTVDEMLVCLPLKERFADIFAIVTMGHELGVVVRFFPDVADVKALSRSHIELFEGDYVVTFFRESMLLHLLIKRLMDLSIAACMVVVLSPLMLVVALIIKFTSRGPVLFAQERMGMNKRRFRLYKFRSMVVDAEQLRDQLEKLNEMDGPVFKIRNDPRVTPVGRFIRKTSIDELPQLFNVLKGDMSLVGPRPPLPSEVSKYEWLDRRRLSIRPGITCLWQISGRNNLSFEQWMELDRQYIENWNIWLDLRILLKTIPVVLLRRGAS